ncbi:MAG: DUF222 domain-containing protein [Actinobacteria bacterium]|nr:DUF222 domain-containing protein [Actinomycetota bacterium]
MGADLRVEPPRYGVLMGETTVAGEPIELLQAAFAKLKHRTRSDGMVEVSAKLDAELEEPLARALVRIEGDLIDQDAADGDPDVRTTSERRADAFVLLAQRLTAASDRS